ncbi:transcription elongation factor SPT5-like protein, partial [Euroglyphus maynei]
MPGTRFRCQLVDSETKFDIWWCPACHHPIRLLRELIQNRLEQISPNKHQSAIRLFFNGQQLDDQYSIRTYGLSDDDVIHVLLSTSKANQSPDNNSNKPDHHHNHQPQMQLQQLSYDDYYSVGDHVDAFNPETGSWYPAQIVRMTKSSPTQVNYHVTFRKSSLGSDQIRSLAQIRPQPYRMIGKDALQPGQTVLVYNNDDHQWYVAAIETTKRSPRDYCMRVGLAFITHGMDRQLIVSKQTQTHPSPINVFYYQGYIEPDCDLCDDDAAIKQCSKCGCKVCRNKADPDKQLVCDECEHPVHLWCLKQPLDQIPDVDDDWYCDECRNETSQQLISQQQLHLQQRQQETSPRTDGWGFGMSTCNRSKHRNLIKSQTFGAIPGVAVGTWWRFRVQASEAGVHAPLVAGIHGTQSLGVYSLVFAAVNSQDIDLGDEIYYTANQPGTVRKRNDRKCVNREKSDDQNNTLKGDALALARNCPVPVNELYGARAYGPDRNLWKQGRPIRVLRSGNNRIPKHRPRSRYLPKIGVRYDGLYKVVSYWPEASINGHQVWRFLLRRDDTEPAPWTDAGRYRTKKLGLQLQYPPGWCRNVAQKRFWATDANIIAKQSRSAVKPDKCEQNETKHKYDIPKHLALLIAKDEANHQAWSVILDHQTYENRDDFRNTVRQTFRSRVPMSSKRKKPRHGGFILEEAEVDSEIEDDEEWEEGAQQDIIDNKMDRQSDQSDRNQHRRLQMILTSEEDQIENYYRRKYAEPTSATHGYDNDAELSNNISQQALMPGVKDPNLWMVKCRIGEEKQTVLQLMRKFIAHQNSDDPLQIKSVVAPEGIKGYIYIEAFKQTHVKQAIQNVGNLRLGLYKQTMVPIAEMTEVLKVTKDTSNLKVNQWVRLKRGLYKDDLAQVDYVDVAQNQVHLKLIPRIDYTRLRGALRAPGNDSQDADKKKRFKKPAAKLFDMDAIRSIGGEVTNDGDFIIFESNRYRRGFLYKTFNMNAIQVEGVKPTLAELERFEEHPEGMEIQITESLAEDRGHSFSSGDNIEVISGELKGLTGKILTIEGNLIKMLANHKDLDAPLPFQPHELRKYFKPGDHVKVIAGRYEGDTGLIIRVEDDQIVLFSDLTMHELRVLHKDLQLCSDMATGVDSMGQYQWGD